MTTTSKPKTRELILETALELFNEQGSHKVSTNHIAKAMGISPGNLYYHYKNKEHIIRELLSRLIGEFDSLVHWESEGNSGLDLIVDKLQAAGELIFDYRFIYIELAALLARDHEFNAMYQDVKERRNREFVLLFEFIAQMGAFQRTITPDERDAVIFIIWTFTEGLITALHTSGIPVTQASVHTHFKKIIFLLKAYLEPGIWAELAEKLAR